jgi:hypothetical protein
MANPASCKYGANCALSHNLDAPTTKAQQQALRAAKNNAKIHSPAPLVANSHNQDGPALNSSLHFGDRSEPVELKRKDHDDVAGSPASLLPSSLSELLTATEKMELSKSQEERRTILSQTSGLHMFETPNRILHSHSYAPGRLVQDPLKMYGRSVPDDIISSPGSRLSHLIGNYEDPKPVLARPLPNPAGILRTSSPLVQHGLPRVKSGVSLASNSPRTLYPDIAGADDLFELELDGSGLNRSLSGVALYQMSYSRAAASNAPRQMVSTTSISVDPRRKEQLCPFAMAGSCHYGAKCRYLHGLECPSCHLNVIHPYGTDSDRQAHIAECELRMEDKAQTTEGKDCAICMEDVGRKKDPRFGVLNCEHTFCLECIRRWRTRQEQDEAKSCPLCRVFTAFVTPSTVWPSSIDEKQKLIEAYKLQMSTIPCKHFR